MRRRHPLLQRLGAGRIHQAASPAARTANERDEACRVRVVPRGRRLARRRDQASRTIHTASTGSGAFMASSEVEGLNMEEGTANLPIAVPNAVLDTNVVHAIYSWHDFTNGDRIGSRSPSRRDPGAPGDPISSAAARAAFILTLLFDERGWTTQSPLNEVGRTLTGKSSAHGHRSRCRGQLHKALIGTSSRTCSCRRGCWSDPEADLTKKSNDVDMLCLDWAEQHKVPLISFEGSGPSGPSGEVDAQ